MAFTREAASSSFGSNFGLERQATFLRPFATGPRPDNGSGSSYQGYGPRNTACTVSSHLISSHFILWHGNESNCSIGRSTQQTQCKLQVSSFFYLLAFFLCFLGLSFLFHGCWQAFDVLQFSVYKPYQRGERGGRDNARQPRAVTQPNNPDRMDTDENPLPRRRRQRANRYRPRNRRVSVPHLYLLT